MQMPISVYVLIQVEKGEPWPVAEEISKIEGVKTAHIVTGQYDKDLIKKIHQMEGVQHTQTAVCIP